MIEKYWLAEVNKTELEKLKKGDVLGMLSDVDNYLNPLRLRIYSLNGKSVGIIPEKYFEHVNYHLTLDDSNFTDPEYRYNIKVDIIDLEPTDEDDDPNDFPMCRIIINWNIKESYYIPFDNTTYIGGPKPKKYIQENTETINTNTLENEKPKNIWTIILFIISAIILALIVL
jgi:hypothetical protein